MIESFKHKGLREFFEKGDSAKISPDFKKRLRLILSLLHAASEVTDMNFPGSHLHALKGDLKGFWSVRVTGSWRLVFRFENGKAFDLDIIDYH